MKRNKLSGAFRTMPANPKRNETYWRSDYMGGMVLTTKPAFWGVFELKTAADWRKRMSDFHPKDALRMFKNEATAEKFAKKSENYTVIPFHLNTYNELMGTNETV